MRRRCGSHPRGRGKPAPSCRARCRSRGSCECRKQEALWVAGHLVWAGVAAHARQARRSPDDVVGEVRVQACTAQHRHRQSQSLGGTWRSASGCKPWNAGKGEYVMRTKAWRHLCSKEARSQRSHSAANPSATGWQPLCLQGAQCMAEHHKVIQHSSAHHNRQVGKDRHDEGADDDDGGGC